MIVEQVQEAVVQGRYSFFTLVLGCFGLNNFIELVDRKSVYFQPFLSNILIIMANLIMMLRVGQLGNRMGISSVVAGVAVLMLYCGGW